MIACPVFGVDCHGYFVAGLQLKPNGNTINLIKIPECTILKSFATERDATHIILKDSSTAFLPFRENFERGYHQILEFSFATGKSYVWAKPPSSGPGKIMTGRDAYWVCFDHVLKPHDQLDESKKNGLTKYQESGFEVYSKGTPSKLLTILRLGEFHHVFEWCWNREKTRIYLVSSADGKRDATGERIFFKHSPCFLQVICTRDKKVIRDAEISKYVKGFLGLCLQDGKLYITGVMNPDNEDGRPPDSLNQSLIIFNEKTLRFIKSVSIGYFPKQIDGSPETHRVFVLHGCFFNRSDKVNNQAFVTVINSISDQVEAKMDLPRAKKIACIKGLLFVMTPDHLIIIDAKTLKIIKTLPGTYNFISRPS